MMRAAGRRHNAQRELPPDMAAANALAAMRRSGELLLLGVLLAVYSLAYALDFSTFYEVMNVAGPVAFTSILCWSCYSILRQSPIAVWAPLLWFRLACAAYYGFGALVPHIVNDETLLHIYSLYYFDERLNFKVNVVYSFGIASVLLFSQLFLSMKKTYASTWFGGTEHKGGAETLLFASLFLGAGGLLRYGFAIPYSFGLIDGVLPGIVITLSTMYYVGIYLLIVYGVNYNRKILLLACILIGLDIVVSVASFAKTELLIIMIFSFLGFISREASRTKIVVGTCCVLAAYFAFQSLVGYGREELISRYGEIRGAGLNERWEIVQSYLNGGQETVSTTNQGGLSRLSYVNADAFVVDRYDAGIPGNTLYNAAAVLVPRVLWPDKPIITQLGTDLNLLVFRQEGSSLGVGHFAEAYWNFGWWGIAPFMAVLALILTVFTRFSMRMMACRKWLFLPVVFIGVKMGLRVDGFFVPDIIGAAWIAICLGLALASVDAMIGKLTLRKRLPAQRQIRRA